MRTVRLFGILCGNRNTIDRLDICKSCGALEQKRVPPLECCLGTSPSQAVNCRPLWNTFASPTLATNAVAVSGPIPSTAINRWAGSLAAANCAICRSYSRYS